jgi:hypothetical protein
VHTRRVEAEMARNIARAECIVETLDDCKVTNESQPHQGYVYMDVYVCMHACMHMYAYYCMFVSIKHSSILDGY